MEQRGRALTSAEVTSLLDDAAFIEAGLAAVTGR